jgi:hypothetical protein
MAHDKSQKKQFKPCPIGYIHINIAIIAEVRSEEDRLYLFVAPNRTCKFAYAELRPNAIKTVAAQVLRNLIAVVPYKIHTASPDKGIQSTHRNGINLFSNTSLCGSAIGTPLHIG